MRPEAVLFDLDNTLINRRLAFEQFAMQFIEAYIAYADDEEKHTILRYIVEADQDGYRSKQACYGELLEKLTFKRATTLEELLEYWFATFFKCTVLMNGAMDTIMYLKSQGMKLGLITNGSIRAQHAKIDDAGIRAYFDAIVVSDEVQVKKPDSRIFNIALERLGVLPEASVYIGDHPLNDMQGAHKAGLMTIWLEGFRAWELTDYQPDYTIRDLREVKGLLKFDAV